MGFIDETYSNVSIRPFSMTSKNAAIEIMKILEQLSEADQIDALAIAVRVYTDESEAVTRCRQYVQNLVKNNLGVDHK